MRIGTSAETIPVPAGAASNSRSVACRNCSKQSTAWLCVFKTMNERRLKRIEELYQQELASLLLIEVDDPLLKGVRVTRVRVTPDLGSAKIYYDCDQGKERAPDVLKGFRRCKGFLKKDLATRIPLR